MRRIILEKFIRRVFERYHSYKAEYELYQSLRKNIPDSARGQNKDLKLLEVKLTAITGWLGLLNEGEAFVVQHHMIEGISWPRMVIVYQERWGLKTARTERMLKTYQANALQKIAEFNEAHMDIIGNLFGDLLVDDGGGDDDQCAECAVQQNHYAKR